MIMGRWALDPSGCETPSRSTSNEALQCTPTPYREIGYACSSQKPRGTGVAAPGPSGRMNFESSSKRGRTTPLAGWMLSKPSGGNNQPTRPSVIVMKSFGTFQDLGSTPSGSTQEDGKDSPLAGRGSNTGPRLLIIRLPRWARHGFDWNDSGRWSYPKADSRYERETITAEKPRAFAAAA